MVRSVNVLIVSDDNSKIVQYGGKHVHQELLERGLKELGVEVNYLYPDEVAFLDKVKIAVRHPFSALRRLVSRSIDLTLFKAFKDVRLKKFRSFNFSSYDIVHAQDAMSAAVLPGHRNIVITLHGYLAREVLD